MIIWKDVFYTWFGRITKIGYQLQIVEIENFLANCHHSNFYENLLDFRSSYIEFLEFLENLDITTLLASSFPRDEDSKKFVKQVAKNSTGIIYLRKSFERKNYSGMLTIKPNIGHFEGEFETSYKIEPIKGIITLSDNESKIMKILSQSDKNDVAMSTQDFDYSNLYSYEEFEFLMESRIAQSKSTGEKINLISFEFFKDNLRPVEIYSKLKNYLEKGDKVSYSENKLFVLPGNSEMKYVQNLTDVLETEIKNCIGTAEDYAEHYVRRNEIIKETFNFE